MYPLMLGHENVGEVVEVGEEVTGLKVGDKVLLPFVDPDPDHLDLWLCIGEALSEYCVVNDAAAYQEGECLIWQRHSVSFLTISIRWMPSC